MCFTQPEFGGCPPIPALVQHLPVSFLHTGHPRPLLSFRKPSAPARFGERPPFALGAHRAAPSAGVKPLALGSLHHPLALTGCKEHHHPPVPAPGTAAPGEMLTQDRFSSFFIPGAWESPGKSWNWESSTAGMPPKYLSSAERGPGTGRACGFLLVSLFFNKINVPFAVCEAPVS